MHFFCELIADKQLLARVVNINFNHKILFIELFKIQNEGAVSINGLLINHNIAFYSQVDSNLKKNGKLSKYAKKIKYPHLFPSFEALEHGFVPCSLWERKLLADNIPLDMLYKDYYKYQSINSEV